MTFAIDSIYPGEPSRSGTPVPPLSVGRDVKVRYENGAAQFLRVGRRYRVKLWWGGEFTSGVHVANHLCSTGTVYADGSSIDTSLWTRSWIGVVGYVVALIILLGVVALVLARAVPSIRRRASSTRR